MQFGTAVNGNHAVILEISPDGTTCGMDIIGNFALNPGAKVDMSCLSDLLHFDFVGIPLLNLYLLGTTDIFDGYAVVYIPTYPESVYIGMVVLAVLFSITVVVGILMLVYYRNKTKRQHSLHVPLVCDPAS